MKVYAHLVEPEKYPNFDPERSTAVTRNALGDRVHFSGLKFLSYDRESGRLTNIRRDIRLFADELRLCDCLSLHWSTLWATNVRELIDYVKEKGLYLGNFWGFVPGFEANAAQGQMWGEFTIPQELHAYLVETLGDHFLGYESGENDGRYFGSYAVRSALAGRSHRRGYQAYLEFHEKVSASLHNRVLQFASLNTAHYQAKLGDTTMLGAETGQALLNSPLWYGFIRGAAKQYGLLTFGAVSVWNRWGYKTYDSANDGKDGPGWGPTKGTSISLMRRLLYQQYFYNCAMLGLQQNWLQGDDGEKWISGSLRELPDTPEGLALSPIGRVQQAARAFADTHGTLGAFHAPVALMLDFYAGWVPPRHLYSPSVYKTWGSLPYRMGDYQAHALFDMLYPGYENAGWYSDESGFLTATPWGDMTDVLLNDADPAILQQYAVLLLANDIEWTYEFYGRLLDYVRQGGHLVLCAGELARQQKLLEQWDKEYLMHFGLESLGGPVALGSLPVHMGGEQYTQTGMMGYAASLLPHTEMVAAAGDRPVICRHSLGNGTISLVLSDTGMERCDEETLPYNAVNNDIVVPYVLAPVVQAYLGRLYREQSPVWVTNGELQFAQAVEDATHVVLQVTNNSHYVQAFSIASSAPIQGVEVIPVEDDVFLCEGYYPEEVPVNNEVLGGNGDYELTAGDVCFYRVTLGEPLEMQPASVPVCRVNNLYLRLLPGQSSLRQFVLDHPTFRQTFTGLLVDAPYLLRFDRDYLQQEAAFLKRQGIRVLVDYLPLLDHYPGLSFLQSFPQRYEESMATAMEVLDRAALFDCAGITLGVVRDAEIQGDVYDLQRNTLEAFERLMEGTRLPVYFVNRPIMFQIDEGYGLAEEANGMRLALDTCSALCVGADLSQTYSEHAIRSLFISAPVIDRYDQRYDAHRPVYTDDAGPDIRRFIRQTGPVDFTVMAADYANWDEVIQDYQYIFLADQ